MTVFSQSFAEHLEHLRTVLRRLRNHGVKLKPKKCNLFANEVCYLGRTVTKDDNCMDPSMQMQFGILTATHQGPLAHQERYLVSCHITEDTSRILQRLPIHCIVYFHCQMLGKGITSKETKQKESKVEDKTRGEMAKLLPVYSLNGTRYTNKQLKH